MSTKNKLPGESNESGIGRLDENTLGYYRRVLETLSEDLNAEQNEIFLNNVFDELCVDVTKVARNQTVSFIIEKLLHAAQPAHLSLFSRAITNQWELMCQDRFASHVTQTFLLCFAQYMDDNTKNDGESTGDVPSFNDTFLQLCSFLVGNLVFHMQHTYSSHILRVSLEILAGSPLSDKLIRSKMSRKVVEHRDNDNALQSPKLAPAHSFKKILKETCSKMFDLIMLADHATNRLSNPVLQTALLALHHRCPKLCQKKCRSLVKNSEMFTRFQANSSSSGLPLMFVDDIGSHLVEQVISIADDALFSSVLEDHCGGKLAEMALHPVANYVLQRLLQKCRTKEQFQSIFDELITDLESILAANHVGVIVQLSEAALRHQTRQKKLVKRLMKAFHCDKPLERRVSCFRLIVSLSTYEKFYDAASPGDKAMETEIKASATDTETKTTKILLAKKNGSLRDVNLHGSLLLQSLLGFKDPKPIVAGLLDLGASEALGLCCDPCGNRVVEAFARSQTVESSEKSAFSELMKNFYSHLACDKYGSRALEALWNGATLEQKESIASSLKAEGEKIRRDRIGAIIWNKFALDRFGVKPEQRKRQQMEDGGKAPAAKRKRRTKPKFR